MMVDVLKVVSGLKKVGWMVYLKYNGKSKMYTIKAVKDGNCTYYYIKDREV